MASGEHFRAVLTVRPNEGERLTERVEALPFPSSNPKPTSSDVTNIKEKIYEGKSGVE
jgi:hypothetical protein